MLANLKRKVKNYIGSKILRIAFYFKDNYCKGANFKSEHEATEAIKVVIYFKLYEWGCRFYM